MVKKFLHKIYNIILGNWRNWRNYHSDTAQARLKICKDCEHNVKFLNTRVCNKCGCIIKAKVTIDDEKCQYWPK